MLTNETRLADCARLSDFCRFILEKAGADQPSALAATRAMMHGSVHGIDSHGVRLLGHYAQAFQGGRLNIAPKIVLDQTRSGTALLNADNGHGAVATFAAIDHAVDLAQTSGIAAIGIQNTSHFGPAGAFSKAAADKNMIGIVFGNSDSFVRLFDGAQRFHGTNPISVAVPTAESNPWLLDMATSSVPYNRVQLHQSLQQDLPQGVASDPQGIDTVDPNIAEMLTPIGGADFGFKGAALGGLAEIFSAVLTGMKLSPDIAPMAGPDFTTPRGMGAFVIVIDPNAFAIGEVVRAGMLRYLKLLRGSKARKGASVMAPGDREWARAAGRIKQGIPLDPLSVKSFTDLAIKWDTNLPW